MTSPPRRFASLRSSRWANGGGSTTVLATGALGASGALEAFADGDDRAWSWRISIASIDQPGPFSSFPGLTRLLMPLDASLALTIGGVDRVVEPLEVVRFDGAAAVSNGAVATPVRVLNVMFGAAAPLQLTTRDPTHAEPADEVTARAGIAVIIDPTPRSPGAEFGDLYLCAPGDQLPSAPHAWITASA